MKNNYIITAIVAFVVAVAAFVGGMKYQQSKMPAFSGQIPGGRQGQFSRRLNNDSGFNPGLSAVRGTVLSADENSITVKLADESSKIVILTDSTTINKSEEGSKEDLSEGTEVAIVGSTNADGSVTAQDVQIGIGMFRRPQ